jgi:hypothetical protein
LGHDRDPEHSLYQITHCKCTQKIKTIQAVNLKGEVKPQKHKAEDNPVDEEDLNPLDLIALDQPQGRRQMRPTEHALYHSQDSDA